MSDGVPGEAGVGDGAASGRAPSGRAPSGGGVSESARALLSQVAADGYGSVSPSVYETGRLVCAARWLDGHRERVAYLLRSQHPDGSWGAPDGYGLVPTLSATDALLSEVDADEPAVDRGRLLDAVGRGLRVLFGWLGEHQPASAPDTIAVEFVVPWLVAEINHRLERRSADPASGLDAWRGDARLQVPSDVDATVLDRLRDAARAGRPVPAKIWHSLEVLGADIRHARAVAPTDGNLGGSPAATAGWLAGRPGGHAAAVRYLHTAQARHGGPVSSILPISVFERAWVLSTLASAGVPVAAPREMVDHLHATFGEFGVPAGVGLPPDSDDTAAALHALALTGNPRPVDPLWAYESDSYFHCFIGERTPSTSTNAHILDALLDPGMPRKGRPGAGHRRHAVGKTVRWLLDRQERDGCWWDKWHASPYYATACCVSALARTGDPAVVPPLRRAVGWAVDSQRADGSWGRWQPTVEETAYAVQVLSSAGPAGRTAPVGAALARAGEWLAGQPDDAAQWPPLWHDKDLYTPVAVVRTARIAALHLTARHGAGTMPPRTVRWPVVRARHHRHQGLAAGPRPA